MKRKTCRKCGIDKPTNAFHSHRSAKDGLQSRCKDCARDDERERREKNRDEINASRRARRDERLGRPSRRPSNLVEVDGRTLKLCRDCGETKPLDEFHKGTGSGRRQNRCKPCAVRRAYQWGRDNNDKFRRNQLRYALKKKYGLTPERVDALMDAQQGRCAICRDELLSSNTAIDHCHVNGNVRGLLCRQCNTGLGMFRDDPKRLRAAIRYLASSATEVAGG